MRRTCSRRPFSGSTVRRLSRPRAWVFQVAHNLAVDHLRTHRAALPLEDGSLPVPQPDLDLGLDVEAALNRLSQGSSA